MSDPWKHESVSWQLVELSKELGTAEVGLRVANNKLQEAQEEHRRAINAHARALGAFFRAARNEVRLPIREASGHIYNRTCAKDGHAHVEDCRCGICEGVLAVCLVCGQAEGELEATCPGRKP